MAVGKPLGHELASVVSFVPGAASATTGYFVDVDGPTSVATANGLGQRCPLGQEVRDDNGNTYIYVAGVASCAQGDWCFYVPGTFALTRLPAGTATNGLLGVAMAAIVANCFGWLQIRGLTPSFTAIATDAAADGKSISANSGTIGRVGTGPVATKNIFNAVAVGASASNQGTAAIDRPFEFGSSTI